MVIVKAPCYLFPQKDIDINYNAKQVWQTTGLCRQQNVTDTRLPRQITIECINVLVKFGNVPWSPAWCHNKQSTNIATVQPVSRLWGNIAWAEVQEVTHPPEANSRSRCPKPCLPEESRWAMVIVKVPRYLFLRRMDTAAQCKVQQAGNNHEQQNITCTPLMRHTPLQNPECQHISGSPHIPNDGVRESQALHNQLGITLRD